MSSDGEQYIAKNRRLIRRREAVVVQEGNTSRQEFAFSSNLFFVDVGIEVYTRPLNRTLISGHPNGEVHGANRGEAGDGRGEWTLVEDTVTTEVFTRGGRNSLRDAFDGQYSGIRRVALGSSTQAGTSTDSTLVEETNDRPAWGTKDDATTTRGTGLFLFHTHGGTASEFGLYDSNGRLIARVTTPNVNATDEEEVRVSLTLSITGEGAGNSVITDEGEEAAADAIRTPAATVGLNEIAWGTGTTPFSAGDTDLSNEVYRRTASRSLALEQIRAGTFVPADEPTGLQPVEFSEIGVYDNLDRLLWATTFDPYTHEEAKGPITGSVRFRFS